MTQEIIILLAVLLLLFMLTSVQVLLMMKNNGTVTALGPRDHIPFPPPGVEGRLYRSIANLKEGLHFFIPLILLTAILGISNEATVLGAQLFLVGRILHTPLYLSGIVSLRTAAFGLATVGLFMIVWGLFI
ncbi:MAG: putative MAPEG superfamily protein [Flavobacterium sp.]|jgi:uncharacterized MAPEG superfamily protein